MRKVSDIDWKNPKFIRAGIIPFVEENSVRFFAFSIGNIIADIGDFGGHKEKGDSDALDTAIREYREEALNIFGEITRDMLQDCYALEGSDTVEILLPVTGPFYKYTEKFHNLIGTNTDHEVQSIIWLSRRQLLTAIDSQYEQYMGTKIYHMYDKIQKVICLNREFI